MATQFEPKDLDVQEQFVRIRKMIEESEKARAETKIIPASLIFQAMLATAALLGAGAAIAKVFFP